MNRTQLCTLRLWGISRLLAEYPIVWQRHSLDGTFPPSPEVRSALREMGGLLPDMRAEDQPIMDLVPHSSRETHQSSHSNTPCRLLSSRPPHGHHPGRKDSKGPSTVSLSLSLHSPLQAARAYPRRQTVPTYPPLGMILGATEGDQAWVHRHNRRNECPPGTLPAPVLTERQRPW